jgi:hypothetical protein
MEYGLDLRASHFSDLVNRDPRHEEPSPPDRVAEPPPLAAQQLEEGGQSPGRVEKGAASYVGAQEHFDYGPQCRVIATRQNRVRLPLGARPELQGLPKEGLLQQQSLGYRDDASARVQLVYVSFHVTMRRGGENAAKNLQGRPNRAKAQVVPGPPQPQIL